MARRPESKPEGTAAATQQEGNGAGGCSGLARRAQGHTVLCRQVHACKAAGRDDGSQQHTAGNRRPGGSTGQEFSVLLPGRTGGSSGLQVRSTCACTQGKGGARSGGNGAVGGGGGDLSSVGGRKGGA